MSIVTVIRQVAAAPLLTAVRPVPAQVLTVIGRPGPAGPAGPIGPPGDGSGDAITPEGIGALAVSMRLAEFSDETAKATARANLGLQTIDGGTF